MSYTALYRKFRPACFEDVKGQGHIVTTLKNQINSDRIGHAYLFCGTRGTGKTTIAKIFARSVNCEHPVDGSPCGECPTCKAIAAGSSMNVIEIDAASNNGVDSIREIVDEVSYSPAEGKYKVYIIDEVHMLSIGAFNALLKTLEEPPSYVIFILATTEVHKLPITILSRCQRYDFKRISIDTICDRMRELMKEEQISVEERALRYIAKTADGSMRDALSLLDQCIAFHFGEELTYDMALDVLGAVDTEVFSRLFRLVIDHDVSGCIRLLEEIVMQGRELMQFVSEFTWYLRNLLLVNTSENMEDVIDISTENRMRLMEEASLVDAQLLIRYIRVFSELSGQLRYAAQKRILIEIALIKLCKPEMEVETDSLLDRIRTIEEKLEKGVVIQGASGQTADESSQSIEKPPLPKAIPNEITELIRNWAMIKGSCDYPMKSYLGKADLSLAPDGGLLIVLEDGVASDYFIQHKENQETLQNLIEKTIERQVSVQYQTIAHKEDFEKQYVDLTQLIQIDIEEDEDEDAQDKTEPF